MTASITTARMVFVLAVAVLLGGCTRTSQLQPVDDGQLYLEDYPELVAKARPPILDLPVPVGFHLDQHRSRNFAAAGARYVDHLYRGRADKFAVGRFYKRRMPVARWVLVTDMFVQGDIMLDFEKQSERCRIIVSMGDLINTVYVKTQLWTTGRITSPNNRVNRTRIGTSR